MTAIIILWLSLSILCEIGYARTTQYYHILDFIVGPFLGLLLMLDKGMREVVYIGWNKDVEKCYNEYLDYKCREYMK